MSRTDWFTNARFGMFIHWGIYAIPAAGEWIYANRDWKDGEYQSLMKQFNPVDYDPRHSGGCNIAWVDGHVSHVININRKDPYSSMPFQNGDSDMIGTANNYWDRD